MNSIANPVIIFSIAGLAGLALLALGYGILHILKRLGYVE